MFTLVISCMTTSNLPWFMGLHSRFLCKELCSLQHQTLLPSPVPFTTGCCFCFGSIPFILSGVIYPLIFSSILGTYRPGEFILQCPISLPFHTVHGVLKARILKWFAIPFSSGPHSVRLLHHYPSVLRGLKAWLSFTDLDKAVVRVTRLPSCLWLWFQSVCPLIPSLSSYHLT